RMAGTEPGWVDMARATKESKEPRLSPALRLQMSTSRPEPGLASTEDTANAPMINPTWDSAPLSSWTTKTGKIAKSRNMLPENRKLLRQSNRKSRVKSVPEAGVAGRGEGCAGSGCAGGDTRQSLP